MHEPFDYTRQPEFAGPIDERRASGGGAALDIQALAQHTVRLPQLNQAALANGEYVPLNSPEARLLLPDREMLARERAEQYHRDLLRHQLRDAAMSAAKDAILADTLTGQVLADVDGWVDATMQPAPAPIVIEPALAEAAEPVEAPAAEAEAEPDPPPAEAADVVNIRPRSSKEKS